MNAIRRGFSLLSVLCILSMPIQNLEAESDQNVATNIVKLARLAPLPKSASEIKAELSGGWFTGDGFLKFRASAKDIEMFLKESPSLKETTPENFNPEHQFIPTPKNMLKDYDSKHKYFSPRGSEWFNPQIRKHGRQFSIKSTIDQWGGDVIVDDDSNVVFVYIIWS